MIYDSFPDEKLLPTLQRHYYSAFFCVGAQYHNELKNVRTTLLFEQHMPNFPYFLFSLNFQRWITSAPTRKRINTTIPRGSSPSKITPTFLPICPQSTPTCARPASLRAPTPVGYKRTCSERASATLQRESISSTCANCDDALAKNCRFVLGGLLPVFWSDALWWFWWSG